MPTVSQNSTLEEQARARFEASLPARIQRIGLVKLQHFIPAHWFAAAASECAAMYIGGHFYGAVSVSQAYVEALSTFLAQHHQVRVGKGVPERLRRLSQGRFISTAALSAALSVWKHRNNFHHLNKDVPAQYEDLGTLARECVNHLHTIESEVFAYAIQEGNIVLRTPEYWPDAEPGMTRVQLRNLL